MASSKGSAQLSRARPASVPTSSSASFCSGPRSRPQPAPQRERKLHKPEVCSFVRRNLNGPRRSSPGSAPRASLPVPGGISRRGNWLGQGAGRKWSLPFYRRVPGASRDCPELFRARILVLFNEKSPLSLSKAFQVGIITVSP